MEQQIAMLLQQVMEVSDRLRQNEESSEQVRQLLEVHWTAGQMLEERMNRTKAGVRDTSQAGGNSAARAQEAPGADDSKVSVVGKLAQILRTPFDGDLLDALTTLERKIMIYEAQSRETISDSLKIGCVIAGMGQNSMKEHLLMSATKCDSWTNFVREIESIEHARKTQHCTDTVEEQRNLNVRIVERNIMDRVGYGVCTSSQKDSQKRGWKSDREGNGKGTRKVESSKVDKAETLGKEKERMDNISTKSQNHQRNSGQVDIGNNGLNNLGTQKPTLRVGVTMIGTLQIRILRPQAVVEEFQHASVGDLRLSNLLCQTHRIFPT